MKRAFCWGALIFTGCSAGPVPPSPLSTPILSHPEVGTARMRADWVTQEFESPGDPYRGHRFYYGDTHSHSGLSGDSKGDQPPLSAFQIACERSETLARRYGPGLGGFFFCVTDHIQYVKTRQDMDESEFQSALNQADSPTVDRRGPHFTFTAVVGAELTGLARQGHPQWDDNFGHLGLLNLRSIARYAENEVGNNWYGTVAMDDFSAESRHLGQFNHPGYGDQPPTGDDSTHLYPYSPLRDEVFRLLEVNDDHPEHWETGVIQYNLCLRNGYHVSPVVGMDMHNTLAALTGQARTVVVMPSTLDLSVQERRQMLFHYLRQGRVYASEHPTLEVLWSLDQVPMGATLIGPSGSLPVGLRAGCNNSPVARIQLVGEKVAELNSEELKAETDCVDVLREWRPESYSFSRTDWLDSRLLQGRRYVYVRVLLASGQRAVTAPIYLEPAVEPTQAN